MSPFIPLASSLSPSLSLSWQLFSSNHAQETRMCLAEGGNSLRLLHVRVCVCNEEMETAEEVEWEREEEWPSEQMSVREKEREMFISHLFCVAIHCASLSAWPGEWCLPKPALEPAACLHHIHTYCSVHHETTQTHTYRWRQFESLELLNERKPRKLPYNIHLMKRGQKAGGCHLWTGAYKKKMHVDVHETWTRN